MNTNTTPAGLVAYECNGCQHELPATTTPTDECPNCNHGIYLSPRFRPIYRTATGEREYTGNPWRRWSDIPRDYKTIGADGVRRVLANYEKAGTALTPWLG